MLKLLTLTLFVTLVTGCSSTKVEDYKNYEPVMQPEVFFDGYLTAHGVIKNRGGRVIRLFNADIEASWDNGVGTLVENFVFDDGEAQQRIWTLEPNSDGSYSGTAGDVLGTATMNVAGNSVFLDYVLQIPYGDSTVSIRVDDRMYLVSPGVLINESSMKKFGFNVGSIDLVILRHNADKPTSN